MEELPEKIYVWAHQEESQGPWMLKSLASKEDDISW